MAEAVQSLPRLRGALRLPSVSPTVAFAIRSGVAVTAAIWLGKAPGLVGSHSTWILITILMLLQPTTGASWLKGLLRAAGTVAGAVSAILLFGLFAQDPPLMMAGLFAVQAIAAYGNSGTRFQYAWFVWAFTTAIVLGDAMTGQNAVETVAFERASMVMIGVVLVMVVDSLFWPARAEPQLRRSLAERARLLGEALRRAVVAPLERSAAAPEPTASDGGAFGNQLALVAAVRSELGVTRASADALVQLAMLLEALASRARILALPLDRDVDSDAASRGLAPALVELGRSIQAALEEVAAAVGASRAPVGYSDELKQALLVVETERGELVRRVGSHAALEGRVADLGDLVAVLGAIESTLASAGPSAAGVAPAAPLRFRPDPFRTKIALRTGLAVVVAFLVPMALGWPMNATVAPVAFLLASMTRGSAFLTLKSLALALAIGWVVADVMSVFVTPHLGRAPLAMLAPFTIAFAFAALSSARPVLAPLPTIGGLVAFLSVFGSTGAPTDVYGAYSTVCYIATALVIGWFFVRSMWPATAAGLFRERVAAQLDRCLVAIHDARSAGEASRHRIASELLRSFAAQSAQLAPLHVQASHEPVERALDPARRTQVLALVTNVMDAVLADRPAAREMLAARGGEPLRPLLDALQREDDALVGSMRSTVEVVRGESTHVDSDLDASSRAVIDRLNELRDDSTRIERLGDDEKRRLLVAIDARRKLVFRQRAIEDWVADWAAAEAAAAG